MGDFGERGVGNNIGPSVDIDIILGRHFAFVPLPLILFPFAQERPVDVDDVRPRTQDTFTDNNNMFESVITRELFTDKHKVDIGYKCVPLYSYNVSAIFSQLGLSFSS